MNSLDSRQANKSLAAGRVTAGLPALDPSLRFAHDKHELKRETTRRRDTDIERRLDNAVAPDGERLRTDYQSCVGFPLHSSQLMRNLAALNSNLCFQRHPSMPVMQIWVNDNSTGKRKFICGFEAELSPEFSVVLWHEEEHVRGRGKDANLVKVKVADDTVKGWRTVLKQLMNEGLINKPGVERMFGTANSCTWQKLTAGY